jgi:hypothetical protein
LFKATISVAVVVTAVWLVAPVAADAQTRDANAARPAYTPPRTPDGQPRITEGIYNRRGVGGLDQGALEAKDHRPENPLDPTEANPVSVSSRPDGLDNTDRGFLEQFSEKLVQERGTPVTQRPAQPRERQLMGIAEPGRILPWKPEANAARQAFLLKTNPAQGLKYVEMDARCMQPGLFFGNGPFQFLQTEGQVTILSEYQHFTRHISLDGRPHLPKNIKMFMGDSVGKWEGNTLVVDTTNYNGITAYSREIPYLTDALHTTERYTLTSANTIDYEVTIDDPNQFTKPWKVTGQYTKADDLPELLEYACWEGSITLRNILGDPPSK